MGWNNPPISWKELERRLSGKPAPKDPYGDAPVSRPKARIETLDVQRPEGPVTPYAELHAHSTFSFLDGASDPRALVTEAVREKVISSVENLLGLDVAAVDVNVDDVHIADDAPIGNDAERAVGYSPETTAIVVGAPAEG